MLVKELIELLEGYDEKIIIKFVNNFNNKATLSSIQHTYNFKTCDEYLTLEIE